jgi:ribosomal protein S18 acetylase RimI-like enzyme
LPTAVRIATDRDLDCLINLILAFRDHGGHDLPTERQLRDSLAILLPDKHTQFFLANSSGDDCAGYLQQRYRWYSLWTQAPQANIEDLYVNPAARRLGVGSALISFAFEQAKSRGCLQISVDTNERNAKALGLYEKLGFSAESPRWSGGRQVLLRRRL